MSSNALRSVAIVLAAAVFLIGGTVFLAYEPAPDTTVSGCLDVPSGMRAVFNEDSGRPSGVEVLAWGAYTSGAPRVWLDGSERQVWFIAAELVVNGGIPESAVWLTAEWPGAGEIYALNDPAIVNSIYPIAGEVGIPIFIDDPDALAVTGCLTAG